MPQASDERVAQVDKWKGLNLGGSANAIGENELAEVINLDLTEGGELVKRTGFKTVHNGATLGANAVRILGFFNTATVQQFIARAGNNLYTSPNGIAWTVMPGGPWGNVEHGVQYTSKFYMVRRDATIVQWDGTTATAIAGSPMGSHCIVFKDRLFVLNSYGLGSVASRVYFSNVFDFSASGWPATNYNGYAEGDGDVLVAIANVQDYLIVFKSGRTFVLYVQGSDTLSWILRPFNNELGCISKNSVVLYENLIYFLSVRGVCQTDGNSVKNISQKISPLFDGIVVSSLTINAASAFVWQDKYVLVIETFSTAPTWNTWSTQTWGSLAATPWSGAAYSYIVYHVRQKGWTKWQPATGLTPHTFASVILSSAIKGVYGGDRSLTGRVFKFGDSGYQDDALSYEVVVETKELDFGLPTERKRGKWLGIEMRTVGSYALSHVVDGVASTALTRTATLSQQEQKMEGPGYFRSWRTRLSATHANPLTLFGYALHMSKRRNIEDSK